MRLHFDEFEQESSTPEPIRFPAEIARRFRGDAAGKEKFNLACLPNSAGQVLGALDDISRRIDHLARELNCLGYFGDEDDDGPVAA